MRLARPVRGAASAPLLFYRRNQNNQTPPNVMRRHREDIFYTTCTACKDFDRRGDNFSVTLSGAIAESKGLEFAEHAPLRITTALAISPSRPLDFARGDSLCCHVERSTFRCEVETSRLIGAFTLTNLPRSAQPAKDERLSAVLRPGWLRTAGAKRLTDQLKPSEKPE